MFDMTRFARNDSLILRNGLIVTYLGRFDEDNQYPHRVRYEDGSLGSRTDSGNFNSDLSESEQDVVDN